MVSGQWDGPLIRDNVPKLKSRGYRQKLTLIASDDANALQITLDKRTSECMWGLVCWSYSAFVEEKTAHKHLIRIYGWSDQYLCNKSPDKMGTCHFCVCVQQV